MPRRDLHDALAGPRSDDGLVDHSGRVVEERRSTPGAADADGFGDPEVSLRGRQRDSRYVFSNHRSTCVVDRAKKKH
jgi:hypothetical protein